MQENKSKILGTLIFLVLISTLFYLIFFSQRKSSRGEIRMIEIAGNNLLSDGDYLSFAKLNDPSSYAELTLFVIKSRLEKHPYIDKADVEYLSGNIAKVLITEKKIEAVLLFNGETKFLTDSFQVLNVLPGTKFMDLPIISNPKIGNEILPMTILKDDDLTQAFEIIDATRLTNEDMIKRLSEINLRSGGEIVLTFTGIKPPVLFGKGGAAKKMVYLDIMWKELLNANGLVENSDYIDLRFANEIFIGSGGNDKVRMSTQKSGLSE